MALVSCFGRTRNSVECHTFNDRFRGIADIFLLPVIAQDVSKICSQRFLCFTPWFDFRYLFQHIHQLLTLKGVQCQDAGTHDR